MSVDEVLAAQRLLALSLLLWFAGRVTTVRRPAGAPRPAWPVRLYAGVIGAGFGVLLAGHAFWALYPAELPGYRAVEKYDPRAWRLERPTDRRRIVDRRGDALAENVRDGARVVRRYPLGVAAAHLTGYQHRLYGKTGAEGAWDDLLNTRRQPAWQAIAGAVSQAQEPEPLRLTIDARLQRAAAAAMGDRRGAVVVLNPAVGDVLVLYSAPSFDPNRINEETFQRLRTDPRSPLLDRALHGLYPPGSTFKPVVAAAALTAGYGPDTAYDVPAGGYLPPFDSQRIQDYEAAEYARRGRVWPGYGRLDMGAAMAVSSNGYFAQLGVAIGAEPILAMARALGAERAWNLARRPDRGGDLTATPGRLPAGRLKPGDVARCAIGQHQVVLTPFALAMVGATIANYGTFVPPRLRLDQLPAAPEPVLEPTVARELQELMRRVVSDRRGTARGLAMPNVAVAAKTGSAENPHGAAHGWVIAFAPVERATVALVVLVENGGSGSASAVPIARAVLREAAAAEYFVTPGEAR